MNKGWEIKTIGDVCTVIAGQSPEGKYYNTEQNGLPFYQGKKEFTDKYLGRPSKWTSKITKEAIADDVLMSVRAPVGPVNLSTQNICIGRGLAAIRANKQLNIEFLFNFLVKHESEITGNTGAVFNSINKSQIEAIEIPIPSLPEQKRIVRILDQVFAAIDKAKENAEKNLANAKKLFESYLNRIFSNPGKDWEKKKLGEISKIMYGFTAKSNFKGNAKFLRITDIQNNLVIWEKVPFCNLSEEDLGKYMLKTGDIVFARTGATTGKSFLLKKPPRSVFASYLIRVQLHKNALLPDFLYLFFQTDIYWNEIYSGISGSAQGGFNATKLGELSIPYPKNEKDQENVIRKLERIKLEKTKLESIYQQKMIDLEELKKSLLKKAFEGELK